MCNADNDDEVLPMSFTNDPFCAWGLLFIFSMRAGVVLCCDGLAVLGGARFPSFDDAFPSKVSFSRIAKHSNIKSQKKQNELTERSGNGIGQK